MPLRAYIAALALAVFSGPALAADLVGYSEAFDTLFRVDLTTRSATEVGRATLPGFVRYPIIDGLTFSPDGKLYGVASGHGVYTLLQISSVAGLATPVGTLNINSTDSLDFGLAFTADGQLWLSAGTGDLWQVNPANASLTLIGNLGVKITGLTSHGNVLYGAGGQGNNNLYVIDQTTAQATLLGAYGSNISYVSAASPAFDSTGQLWMILDYVPPPSGITVAAWSDLASAVPTGALVDLGQITAEANTQSFDDLQYIGLRGFAITPPSPQAKPADTTPALAGPGLASLVVLLALLAGTRLGRRRPSY